MVVNVPRPTSADLRMNQLFGADPMPTVNKRPLPSLRSMRLNSSASLPTAPSVMKITWRKWDSLGGRYSASSSAARISVPPFAARAATKFSAMARFLVSASTADGNSGCGFELKAMTLKRSPGRRPLSARRNAVLA